MLVATAIGTALVRAGVDQAFGVVGSGNFHVTRALRDQGARFVATRHEGGAVTMADGYTRISGRPSVVSVHQGCGLTNTMTGLAEAAKSRTPIVVLAAETTSRTSNFFVDQDALATAVGAVPMRITGAETAVDEALAALTTAVQERRTVLLNLPLEVQALECDDPGDVRPPQARTPTPVDAAGLERLVAAVRAAQRPVFVAGRGGRESGPQLRRAAELAGALLAESAVAKGLFHDDPWSLGISGGFSTPTTAELVQGADLVVGWGCALNMWTMRHGTLIGPGATVVQVDDTEAALGRHRDLTFGVVGDVGLAAAALSGALADEPVDGERYRTDKVQELLAGGNRWRDVPYDDSSTSEAIDPRLLSSTLDDLLPEDRLVAIDSGNFMGYPSMFLDVPDEEGFVFTQAFQSIGLGLSTAIGAAFARPDRLTVAATGDGGLLMGIAELETIARERLPMVVVAYNDHAYGAEVHHFHDADQGTVAFPDTDIASIARGFGMEALTVRTVDDLAPVADWVSGPRERALLVDAKITAGASWWLEEAFKGH